MRTSLAFIFLCVLCEMCNSGCKKDAGVVVKTDTLIVRDTIYSKLIRTDTYYGDCRVDFIGGSGDYSANAFSEISFYTNDSTNFIVHFSLQDPGFQFSVVNGKYILSEKMKLGSFHFVGPDSLYAVARENTNNLSERTYTFTGRIK